VATARKRSSYFGCLSVVCFITRLSARKYTRRVHMFIFCDRCKVRARELGIGERNCSQTFFPLAIAAFVCAIQAAAAAPTIASHNTLITLVRPQIFCTAGEKTRVNCALCILRTAGCGSHHYFAIERYVIAQFWWFVCAETPK
jgi:hypothetical protein